MKMKPGIRKRQGEIEDYLQSLYVPLNYDDVEYAYNGYSIEKMEFDEQRLKGLIEQGVYLNKSLSPCNYNPIWIAILNYVEKLQLTDFDGLIELTRYLVEHGADLNKKDELGRACLDSASDLHNFTILRILIDHFNCRTSDLI